MALNLEGWVTPEQTFEGLYRAGDDIRANRRLEQQEKAERERLAQREEAQKNATSTYLQSYLNPKHYLTGTNFDPVFSTRLSGILQKAMGLASQGLDSASITYAISPDVEDISEASQRVKAIENQRKQTVAQMKSTGVKGIDYDKFNSAFKNRAYYEDGQLKDLANVDVDRVYGDEVLKDADVYNDEGISDFVAKSGKVTYGDNVKVIGRDGRMRQTKAEISHPSFMMQETDPVTGVHKDFVPKYDLATDEDSLIMHTFKDDNGNEVKAPIRMVTDEVFSSLPPVVLGKIRHDVKEHIKAHPSITINSAQAETLAKTLAYDYLKNSGKQYSSLKETNVDKAAPERPYSFYHGSSTAATQEPKIVNLYEAIDKMASEPHRMQAKPDSYLQANLINSTAQKIVLDIAREATSNKYLDIGDIYLKKDPSDGQIYIRNKKNNDVIAPLDPNSLNIPANAEIFKLATNKGKTEAQRKIDISTGSGHRTSTPVHKVTSKGVKLPIF